VNRYLEVLAASTATFAVTNIDDALLLTLFFAKRIPARRIIAGQYLGFAIILLISLIGAVAALAIPHRWIRFLGVVPLAIGARLFLQAFPSKSNQLRVDNLSVASIALLTFSNGADNVGVYVPFFVVARAQVWLILTVYGMLVAVWCFVGRWLGTHSFIFRFVDRWADRVVPAVFILLGTYILISA
jgi:cadmium resistance protein CadD (predicted permease)